MARIRTIKPEFWTDEKVMDLSPVGRLLFIGLWNFCDDHGRMPCSPRTIKAQIFPDDAISIADVEGLLHRLAENGQIRLYAANGKSYLAIANWDKHQKIDNKSKPRYPAPESDADPRADSIGISEEREGKAEQDTESRKDTDSGARAAEADLRGAIVRAFEAAHAPAVPDTARVSLWLSQNYEPDIILAVIADIVKRKPSVGSLNYFDSAIREAHAQKVPKRATLRADARLDIEDAVKLYARTRRWSRWAGPEPGMINCRAGPELLAKYGLLPDGRKAEHGM